MKHIIYAVMSLGCLLVPAQAAYWNNLPERWLIIHDQIKYDANSVVVRSDHSNGKLYAEFSIKAASDGVSSIATIDFDECRSNHSGILHIAPTEDPTGTYKVGEFNWSDGGISDNDLIGQTLCNEGIAYAASHAEK